MQQQISGIKWKSKYTLRELLPNNSSIFFRIFESLKYKNYSLFFWGQTTSLIGTWMQVVAMSWLVYRLTQSVVLLGTVAFLTQIPTLFLTPFTGALADRYDKRKLLMISQSLYMLEATLLAILTLTHIIQPWHILGLSLFAGFINAFDMPVRQSFYSKLVPPELLTNAVALNSAIINGSRLIGPAIGGFIIQLIGEGGCFTINAISFIFVLYALKKITFTNPSHPKTKNRFVEIKEGFQFVKNHIPIRVILLTTTVFSFCIFSYATFMPAYVKDILLKDSSSLGIIMSAVGIGALSSALFLAARKSVLGLGKMVVIAITLASVSLMPFFFIHSFWFILPLSVCAGFGITSSLASINTLLQTLTTDPMRGRVMAYYSMCFVGSSAVGSLFWSYVAKMLTLSWSMAICCTICLITAFAFEKYRPIVRLHSHPIYVEKGIIKEIAHGINEV
ncbi:MAG: MFS transporter [Bacteroidales bacterium]|jgi:MFS family permease|nr:MFS transporter [Bacteroidales bacterium]